MVGIGIAEEAIVELLYLMPLVDSHIIQGLLHVLKDIYIGGLAEGCVGVERIKGVFDVFDV
ncbi:hypothetical protein [Thermoleptolyngbya sp.]